MWIPLITLAVAILGSSASGAAEADLTVTPPAGEVGTSVIIGGGGFDQIPVNNQVTFAGQNRSVPAEWVSDDARHILVRVPPGTADGPIGVLVKNRPLGAVAFKVKPQAVWPTAYVWIGIVVALLFRTFIPFWNKKLVEARENRPIVWNWWLVLPPLAAAVISVPIVLNLLPSIGHTGIPYQDFLASFSVTYASQDLIREIQKALPEQ